MKKTFLTLIAAVSTAIVAQAATVTLQNFSADDGSSKPIVLSDGSKFTNNTGYVALGAFGAAFDEATFAGKTSLTAEEKNTIVTAFIQFGDDTTKRTNLGGPSGLDEPTWFQAGVNGSVTDTLTGKNIYVVIGNGDTLAASSELLVYKTTQTWAAEPPPFLPTVDLTAAPASGLLVGSVKDGITVALTGATASGFGTANAGVIPEPASAAFILLTGAGLLARRRR